MGREGQDSPEGQVRAAAASGPAQRPLTLSKEGLRFAHPPGSCPALGKAGFRLCFEDGIDRGDVMS